MLSHLSISVCNRVDTRNKHLQLFHPASLFFAFVLFLLFLFSPYSPSSFFSFPYPPPPLLPPSSPLSLFFVLCPCSSFYSHVLRPISLFFVLFPCSSSSFPVLCSPVSYFSSSLYPFHLRPPSILPYFSPAPPSKWHIIILLLLSTSSPPLLRHSKRLSPFS